MPKKGIKCLVTNTDSRRKILNETIQDYKKAQGYFVRNNNALGRINIMLAIYNKH